MPAGDDAHGLQRQERLRAEVGAAESRSGPVCRLADLDAADSYRPASERLWSTRAEERGLVDVEWTRVSAASAHHITRGLPLNILIFLAIIPLLPPLADMYAMVFIVLT